MSVTCQPYARGLYARLVLLKYAEKTVHFKVDQVQTATQQSELGKRAFVMKTNMCLDWHLFPVATEK